MSGKPNKYLSVVTAECSQPLYIISSFRLFFLRSLYDDRLIQYNFGLMQWIWDDDAIKSKLVTQNVAQLMVSKLKRLTDKSQNVLKVASCLGASFSLSNVSAVVDNFSSAETETDCDETMSVSSTSVREFEEEGLWERENLEICRFSHDQIQSAAFLLIPEAERDTFRGTMGNILMKKLDPDALEESLFEVVSLRNCAISLMNREERKALAEMNLRAGLKASDHAAFDTAAVYFKAGRELLGSNAWEEGEDEFNTMLKLCCEEANACYIIGDYDTMNVLIEEVLSKDVPIKDSFKVYEVKILAMKANHQFLDAITTALDVRRQLGLSAPPNKPPSTLTVVKEYIKTNRAVKGRTAEELVALPELKDERIIMGQRMLELLLAACYQGQPTLFPLMSFLLVRTSVKHGINASSCDAFATFGLLLT